MADRQPYHAEGSNVTFRRWPDTQGEPYWVVRGGELKGFGKIPRFTGAEAECREVAKTLNRVHNIRREP